MKTWKYWPGECGICGGSAQILTEQEEEGWCSDGDQLRCDDPECGATGTIHVMDEDSVVSTWRDRDGDEI